MLKAVQRYLRLEVVFCGLSNTEEVESVLLARKVSKVLCCRYIFETISSSDDRDGLVERFGPLFKIAINESINNT